MDSEATTRLPSSENSGSPRKPDADGKELDKQLLGRVAGGDEAALGELYDRYSGLMLALARRVLGDSADAEEVLQEVFLQVWKQAPRYDTSRSSVSTWMALIARSRAIDRLRNRQVVDRTLAGVQQEKRGVHTSPEGPSNVWMDQRSQRLRHEMEALPAEQRQVLELAFFNGMTQSEIAIQTGIPLGTVKTRTLLAMKKLRQALQADIRDLL